MASQRGPGGGVHWGLKPANRFLTGWVGGRVVKVGDYGLPRAFDETGLSGGPRPGEATSTRALLCCWQVLLGRPTFP